MTIWLSQYDSGYGLRHSLQNAGFPSFAFNRNTRGVGEMICSTNRQRGENRLFRDEARHQDWQDLGSVVRLGFDIARGFRWKGAGATVNCHLSSFFRSAQHPGGVSGYGVLQKNYLHTFEGECLSTSEPDKLVSALRVFPIFAKNADAVTVHAALFLVFTEFQAYAAEASDSTRSHFKIFYSYGAYVPWHRNEF